MGDILEDPLEPVEEQTAPETAEASAATDAGASEASTNGTTEETTQENEAEVDEEIEALKRKVQEIQEDAERLDELQKKMTEEGMFTSTAPPTETTDAKEADSRSVYVGNVDYGASAEELQAHFQSCGIINRVTILCDKWTGRAKGYAYVEFKEADSVANAVVLNESMFRGRQLKVCPKRTNVPGLSARRGGFRGRGRGFRGYRGRRGGYYHPYR